MTIELKVNNQIFAGWKSVRIPFGIEQIANSFELGITEKRTDQETARPIKPGDACQVLIDGEIVITGHVDDANPEFDIRNHSISISGRDATGDLVDCSAIHKTGQWRNVLLDIILRDLCQPFGIQVVINAPLGARFKSFNIQEGETVFECIDRACRMRAVLPISDGNGRILVTRAKSGAPTAALIEGENIKWARGEFSHRERYSKYIIKGQDRGSDDNIDAPEQHTQVNATVIDNDIKRYRPLIILAEDKGGHATYQARAEWEKNVRRGRGARASVRVAGWHSKPGQLWRANTLAQTLIPYLHIDANLLIVGGYYILNKQQGMITELSLVDRKAFDLLAGVKASRLGSAIKTKAEKAKTTKAKKSDDEWDLL